MRDAAPEWQASRAARRSTSCTNGAGEAIEAARVNARGWGDAQEVGHVNGCVLDVRSPARRHGATEPWGLSHAGRRARRAILEGWHGRGLGDQAYSWAWTGLGDSHLTLPVVDAGEDELAIDLEPFERLRDAAMGMTSHLLYTQWDAERPASQSPTVIHDIIRERIGFDGFLMSDDIDMGALSGDHGERASACIARAVTGCAMRREEEL